MTYRSFRPLIAWLFAGGLISSGPVHAQFIWNNLPAAPYNGAKQDGVFFLNKDTGWVVNGSGRIHRTLDGGTTWVQQANSPGTYFRAVAFMNEQIGFAGNIGPNYFPGVSDPHPLYRTVDGGNSWVNVTAAISGAVPTGICAIQAVDQQVVYAAGRVGGPPVIIKSGDAGQTWNGLDLSPQCEMILDIHFHSPDTGLVFAGTSTNVAASSARILRTTDGGQTWTVVYTSSRPYELMWKASFPSPMVGYATIQSYNSNTTQRHIVKTTDGGLTWNELPLVNTGVREFGIGFINDSVGWVGAETTGYETLDGGLTWTAKNIGQYANKFSIVRNPDGNTTAYAVGLRLFKMTTDLTASTPELRPDATLPILFPNPVRAGSMMAVSLEKVARITGAEMIAADGKVVNLLFTGPFTGVHESPFMVSVPTVPPGTYTIRFLKADGDTIMQRLVITD